MGTLAHDSLHPLAGTGPSDQSADGVAWAAWELPLARFSAATGLGVSAFELDGTRRICLQRANPLLELLDDAGAFAPDAVAQAFERECVSACVQQGVARDAMFHDMLRVRAVPIRLHGVARAVVLFGWVFERFGTSIDSERLARLSGASASQILSALRETAPTSASRFDTLSELLETMIASNHGHLAAISELQATSRTRDILLAQVSHELRGPLMTCALRIQLLLDGDLSNLVEVRRQLGLLQASVEEEADMVEDLIETARTRNGQLTVNLVRTQLVPLLQRAIETVSPRAAAKELAISLSMTSGDDALLADEARLQQVFGNLLANAVKFTPAKGKITVQLSTLSDTLEVRVSDTGCGIDTPFVEQVFEAFAQARPGSHKGLGLGLSVAKQLVSLHGGSIAVESAGRDLGTTFIVRLPRLVD
jgi:signal transduction histidine kinase